jgi:hypothetical protein
VGRLPVSAVTLEGQVNFLWGTCLGRILKSTVIH